MSRLLLYLALIYITAYSLSSGPAVYGQSVSSLDDNSIIRTREVDISWDFDDNDVINSGWGNATREQMDMEVKVREGELRCSIIGYSPKVESPNLFIETTPRHYLTFRTRYTGVASTARWLFRSGNAPSPDQQLILNMNYWTTRSPIRIIDATSFNSSHPQYNFAALVDADPYTYYRSNSNAGIFFIFDLQNHRWVSSLRILPFGDSSSPKNCILQSSMTTGVGAFQTVTSFTLVENLVVNGAMQEQVIQGFNGYARYWRLIILNNYGNLNHIGIRDLQLDVHDDTVNVVPFNLDGSGVYQINYIPIHDYFSGVLLKMRMELLYGSRYAATNPIRGSTRFREALAIDYVRIVRAPEIWRVRGCLDKYYENSNYQNPDYNVTSIVENINGHLAMYSFIKNTLPLKYATTYDCPVNGGVNIIIDGINFGPYSNVFIGKENCPVVSNTYSEINGREQTIICTLPALPTNAPISQRVRVQNAIIPGLFHEVPSLDYRVAPPVLMPPIVTNIGARRVDLVWSPPPNNVFETMTVTGYKILWFQPQYRSRVNNITVGNVTTTSVRGLEPATEYVFAIAAIAEGHTSANLPTDLYGRRDVVGGGDSFIGTFSVYTNITATLLHDFDFSFFNANQTMNSSGSSVSNSVGPTGLYGSEGNYGLVIVGSANIQNCNVSSTCCDGYNSSIGISSCGNYRSVCVVFPSRMLAYDFVKDSVTRRGVPSSLPYPNGAPPEIDIITLEELIANKGANLPSLPCGPSLRLTPSAARESGSAWYRRKVNVREGFDTSITFEISNPSQKCDRLDDVNTYCRSRGADGLAFVIQNVGPEALGNSGSGLGYEGIFNALSVELDTYHNFENMDFYENHISVLTQGFRYNISANHSSSLATSNRIPDLTDGRHTVRIKYDPNFDENAVPHPSFQANGFTAWFLSNGDFSNGGEGDWGTGFGLLYVYLDDMYSPIITTPLNLGATLDLDDGRAYVGLTAATGNQYWQAHDVLSWQFDSLFVDERYTPPLRLNGFGAHQCVNLTECVHPEDYDHFMRRNNLWGKGQDSTEGWQEGSEGFCAFC
mmetsp:Transcript_6182/g.8636  ORF Transcript_6182/g.8636 Transcript_6182/m.8636 type:complete len:1059 (+) Transcript_6182:817-3993(+)|eukprot:CAMPEP_0170067430 /NCGR_PEP_ID=MMETSP0019_2-20121128/6779_1 /TAXON_ID=98059 /ORGANISM="Dinobryon sp., Strain UTEXLB2267" /LENGTH=1058 /DNA_ID=CAMNT_0010274815 /DNA_START=763 /DNA_END=3939 /DNA_ORIENTATION=-